MRRRVVGPSARTRTDTTPSAEVAQPQGLAEAIGCTPLWVGRSKFDVLVRVGTAEGRVDGVPSRRTTSAVKEGDVTASPLRKDVVHLHFERRCRPHLFERGLLGGEQSAPVRGDIAEANAFCSSRSTDFRTIARIAFGSSSCPLAELPVTIRLPVSRRHRLPWL